MHTAHIHHIIFDLDNTLWDFSGNSKKILAEIYAQFNLKEIGIHEFEIFHQQYKMRNDYLWDAYRLGNATREEVRFNRFYTTLNDFNIDNYLLSQQLADYYVSKTKYQTDLLPNALATLQYLEKKYKLHIITNGFEEVQFFKLKNSGLIDFFKTITTAESARCLKPDKKIFDYAIHKISTEAKHCIYIGDSAQVDGEGALHAGMEFIFFNPDKKNSNYTFTHEIQDLIQLKDML